MAIPLPLRGIDISLVRITLQTVNASTGALTDSATIGTITAVLAGAGVRGRMGLAPIKAITSARQNNVPIDVGWEVVLREILDRRASALPSTGPVLMKLSATMADPAGTPFAKVEITRGGNSMTIYCVFEDIGEGPYVDGENTAEMTLAPIDNGASTFSYA